MKTNNRNDHINNKMDFVTRVATKIQPSILLYWSTVSGLNVGGGSVVVKLPAINPYLLPCYISQQNGILGACRENKGNK